ncbi:hypothetical protein A3I27_03845 [Candidatus Giovannonibacteria bacterium RIFCSPLOWO2_02_FULL_43_11b]|uniref:Phosphomannomutase/phosphoglucomutase n=1 Tax=Candidatus Giovannonibacteria bacterium RIFCSPHIGHO2_12_FULL_43_15 TaxID=1798341 RepID=A0A1F5WNP2_9BACT|nr:MAG: hypothetical protein A2739_00525 [Candidatus Giovannonibacteria bacterium RIFCSPHIGHO2_01_FULL_43_100]OGF66157.1 MAG: hypothetical protein A3B97_03115 [Candidatus Giovannonibacteria bacterium RIFCSPHIGHO2_02_FULL_43_32]OGF77273.1 MAG: hypothetical protein A3F23_02070 [Candidatus Giovannonibacteria bacterium RIFCSPHIGHO2_12_FULL_43_15]OGF78175.1 MAG: hypothetical protein A3A15_00430 [Candidatus Giovannonibacteria bacterium RIFCSPLOWO2_01_FULL_43_60]OGF89127.1 MAG: hypothetical protein A3
MDVHIKKKAFHEEVFKPYDIRGFYPEKLDHNTIELIAEAFAEFLKSGGGRNCVVGEDVRSTSPEIAEMVIEKLLARGIGVIYVGQATTPMHLFSVAKSKADGGIMVTASHNPIQFNGFKIYKGIETQSEKTGLNKIKEIIKGGVAEYGGPRGTLTRVNFLDDYVEFLTKNIKMNKKINAVFDVGGGAVGLVLSKILPLLKDVNFQTLFMEPDPSLLVREPNPFLPEAQRLIRETILNKKADVGFLFDPDGDRVFVLDEKGEVIRGDGILWLLSKKFAHPGDRVVYDYCRSSRALVEDLEVESIKCFRSRVGHSFIKEEMRIEDAILGGEVSGHYYFKDFFYSDSALFATIKILQVLSSSKEPLSEMMRPYFRYFHSGEINFEVKNKGEMKSAFEEKFKDGERDYFDGVTFRYPEWWFNIRPSGTEDLLRFVLEAKSKTVFDAKKEEVMSFLFSKGAKLA